MPRGSRRQFPRTVRLDEQFREEISKLLMKGLKDPRIGFVTISRVEISNDLSFAKVFISVLGSDREKAASLIGLRNSAGFIRTYLGKALKIRKTPQLNFLLDESLDYASHIEEILAELKERGEL